MSNQALTIDAAEKTIAIELADVVMDTAKLRLDFLRAKEECSPASQQVAELMKFLPRPRGRPRKTDRNFEIICAIQKLVDVGYQAKAAISIVNQTLAQRHAEISEKALEQIWLRYRRWQREKHKAKIPT